MNKICIIQTAFIGDVILATSLIKQTRDQFPNADIYVVVRKGNESLVKGLENVREVIIWDKNNKWSSLLKTILKLRSLDLDLVLNIQRFFNSGLMTSLSGAKVKVGFNKNPLSLFFTKTVRHLIPHPYQGDYLHEVQRNYQLLTPFIKDDQLKSATDLPLELPVNEMHRKKVKDYQSTPYIVAAPTSVWFTKQWQIEKWEKLCHDLSKNFKVFVIGAPSDRIKMKSLEKYATNLAGDLNFLESAALMEKAQRVFVNDSAPLHLASAVQAKTTAIFCSTSKSFGYYPLSHNSNTISLEKELECIPCGLHGHLQCPLKHFKCSAMIDVKVVAETAYQKDN